MADNKQKTILVIDDETGARNSIVDYLEDRNYVVMEAENGSEGLDLFDQHAIDLVLTDLKMPVMDGLAVLAHLNENSPETPVIAVSGTGEIEEAVQALRNGAWDYIIKPITNMSFVSFAIDKALDRHKLLQEKNAYQQNLEKLVQERTTALENANAQLTNIVDRLRFVINSTSKLAKCPNVPEFGSILMNEFTVHMDTSGGSLFLVESSGLRLLSTKNPERVPQFIPFPLPEKSVLRTVMEKGQPVLIDDINSADSYKPGGWKGYKNSSALAFPIPDENGQTVGILTLHNKNCPPFKEQDKEIGSILISSCRETLRAIQHLEKIRKNADQQRDILNSLHAGVVLIDPDTYTITDVNSEAAKLIGLAGDEIVGRTCKNFICDHEKGICPIDGDLDSFDNVECILLTAKREEIPILKTSAPIQLEGKNYYLTSFVDISSNKEIEREKEKLKYQLIEAQKMEAIGILAGGLAHDLNNALNGIFGPVSLLQRKMNSAEGIGQEKMKIQLDRIHYSSGRISDIVRQLMTISQKQELSLKSVDLVASIDNVLKVVRSTFDKSIEFKTSFQVQSAITMADPSQVEQLVLNLLINASHAMTIMRKDSETWGGLLEVELKKIAVDKAFKSIKADIAEGEYWLLSVHDSGVGMSDEEITKIFNPFYSSKAAGEGTGLGLAMVFTIVQQHNGTITVDSSTGVGSTFNVYLPLLEAKENKQVQLPEPEELKGSGKILIVDDEQNIRDTNDEILTEFGYTTLMAENGLEAIKIFQKEHQNIDLIILDLIMPKMSGDAAYKELRKINPSVPILLVSGFKKDKRVQGIINNKATSYLQKPYDLYSLASTVKRVLKDL